VPEMNRQLQAIIPRILLMCLPLSGGSGAQQAITPAADTQANTKTSTSTSSQSSEDRKSQRESTHKVHIRLGALTVGVGYTHLSGVRFGYPYGFYPLGYDYSPFFWKPLWGPYSTLYYPGCCIGFQASQGKGEVQLTAPPGKAEVYLDGAYAGTAQNLKRIWLDPGAYDLSVIGENCAPFHKRIYVLSGKKLKVNALLAPQKPTEVTP